MLTLKPYIEASTFKWDIEKEEIDQKFDVWFKKNSPGTISWLLGMPGNVFTLQHCRAGKYFNVHWMPSDEQFIPDGSHRVWPKFVRY
jgi:hypothetical protein